jgi:phosphatidylglycerol---prolipoprotein diacylglyceryl transferase
MMLASISYPPIPIWDLGPLRFSLHGLFAALGFLAGGWLVTKNLNRRGFSGEAFQSVLSWALVGSILGARYFTTPAALLGGTPVLDALNPLRGNFSIMGGFAGGILIGIWRMRKVGLPVLATLDAATFGLALGTIVGRVGDLSIVEHLGRATSVAWGYGVKPAYDLAPQHDGLECVSAAVNGFCAVPGTNDPGIYHHVAAYDLLGAAILMAVLYQVVKRRLHYGQMFAFWIAWYGFQRFTLDFMRIGNGDAELGSITWNQASGLVAGLAALGMFAWFGRKPWVSDENDVALRREEAPLPVA